MLEIFIFLAGLAVLGGGFLVILILIWFTFVSDSSAKSNLGESFVQSRSTTTNEAEKGDQDMLPRHLWEQISKIIEENTGIEIPRPKSIEEILSSIPAKDRAKLLPTLIPLVIDAIQQSTGMNLDASLALQEFLLGRGLSLTELDVAIEADKMKLEKTLAARKQYKEIVDHCKEELGNDPVVNLTEKMFLFKLMQETFKDMQLPPGWSPQEAAELLNAPSSDDDSQILRGEVEK